MKSLVLSFYLIAAAVCAPTPQYPGRVSRDIARVSGTVNPSTLNCIPATQMVLPSDQHEVPAVVVDMPQRASLEYASPETWGALPTFDPPEEESPTKPVLQVALN